MSKKPPLPLVLTSQYEPLVPEGLYTFAYVRHFYVRAFAKTDKLFMEFRIITQGKYFETILKRFYNVKKSYKSYRAPPNGDLSRELASLFGRASLKHGIIPFEKLKEEMLVGEVQTVTVDSSGRDLGAENEYSKLARLIKIEK